MLDLGGHYLLRVILSLGKWNCIRKLARTHTHTHRLKAKSKKKVHRGTKGVTGLRAMNGTIWAAEAVCTNVPAAGLCYVQEGGQSPSPARAAESAD